MLAALLLSASLAGQGAPAPVPSAEDHIQATAPEARPAARAAAVTPARPVPPGPYESTIRKRREALAKKKVTAAQRAARERWEAEQRRLYLERVGPVIAAQQREAWQRNLQMTQIRLQQQQLQIEASKANALQRMATAQQIEAWKAMQSR